MCITLNWVGPYSFGHFSELRQYPYASNPHVYIRVQSFSSRKIVAVGKAANLQSRMNEHLRDLLGRQCYLRDENPAHRFGAAVGAEGEGLAVFDSLDEWLGVAVAEVKRFSFFAAPCDSEKLAYVEAELIDRLWRAAESSGGRIERDNWRREGTLLSGGVILKYHFSTPSARAVLDFIPEAPARLPEPMRPQPESSPATLEPGVYTYSAPGMPMCPECGQRPCIFYCSTHQIAVCLECVAKHDRRGECAYLPAYRAPKSTAAETATSELDKPSVTRRSQSILGIE